jgi:hypothetical protein
MNFSGGLFFFGKLIFILINCHSWALCVQISRLSIILGFLSLVEAGYNEKLKKNDHEKLSKR